MSTHQHGNLDPHAKNFSIVYLFGNNKMTSLNDINVPFKSKLVDVVRGNIRLTPSLQSSFLRHGKISSLTIDEKYLLYFSIVNKSSNAVLITDDQMRIIYVNEKFEKISGYSEREVIGKNPRFLKSNKTPDYTYKDMHTTLNRNEIWKGEFVNTRPNGEEYVEEVTISPIIDDKGNVACYLGEKKDITLQKEAERMVKTLTYTDTLTNIYNRTFVVEKARELTNLPKERDNFFAAIFIDLNRFKKINDIYGHPAGDKVLKIVAERLKSLLSENDFISRVGGDEFLVIHKCATVESTYILAQKIVSAFYIPVKVDSHEHYLGASIGSAIWPKDGDTLSQIFSRADLAMYEAKYSSDYYSPYTKEIGDRYSREFELSQRLELAILNNELTLVYQPKIDLKTGESEGFEALLRWNDPVLGVISPSEFIAVAEKYKLMTAIGNWVIREVCKQLNLWKKQSISFKGRVSINLSVQQIEYFNFYQEIISIFISEKVCPCEIDFEVTESLLISDPERVISIISQLKSVGFSISIDDFGTGYSSLAYLHKLSVDTLKIDRSFIERIATDPHEQAIVKSMIELGHSLGLTVVAEGVETLEQKNFLLDLGCDYAQGFLFYKPVSGNDLFPMKDHSKTLCSPK